MAKKKIKRKNAKKSAPIKRAPSPSPSFSWKFPTNLNFMRIELLFLLVLGVLVFILTSSGGENRLLTGLIFTVLFLVIYFFISFGIRHISTAEENYEISSKHIHLTKRRRSGITKTLVPWGKIIHHKLDKSFLGGYLVTSEGVKHLLFFNAKEEVQKFEEMIQKHLKPSA
jgi:hypothetical protein